MFYHNINQLINNSEWIYSVGYIEPICCLYGFPDYIEYKWKYLFIIRVQNTTQVYSIVFKYCAKRHGSGPIGPIGCKPNKRDTQGHYLIPRQPGTGLSITPVPGSAESLKTDLSRWDIMTRGQSGSAIREANLAEDCTCALNWSTLHAYTCNNMIGLNDGAQIALLVRCFIHAFSFYTFTAVFALSQSKAQLGL